MISFLSHHYNFHKLFIYFLGEHHYYDVHNAYGLGSTSKMFFERDQEKKKLCAEKGVFLVCIPYWYSFILLVVNFISNRFLLYFI
jgi:hypothetical protein